MIKNIAHLGDVHIHNLQRHEEYRTQFSKLYNILEEKKPDRIVIVGDLFEKFVDISNEAKTLAGEFLTKLSDIAIVVITLGNHDIMKKNKKRLNSVFTVVNLLNNDRIIYLDKSGFYEDENVVWVNYSHIQKDIDPWIDIPHTKDESKTYISLYHDPINDSKTDTNQVFKSTKYKSINDFKDNDIVMLADIHKLQYFRKDKTAAYCSSTIQQHFGELPENHGFILWDLDDNITSKHIHIPNDHTYINFTINENTDYDNLNFSNKYITEKSEIKIHWKDISANINYENELKIRKYFKDKYNILGIKISKEPLMTEISNVKMVNESIDILDPNIHRKIFIEFLEINGYEKDYINEILKIDDIITDRLSDMKENMGISWSIDEVWFNNFKSYGDDNKISWKNKDGIYQITGINQQGKTTILDAISYILYGKTMTTTKREKNGDNRYINNKRDLDYCNGGAVITINDDTYTLLRNTERKWNRSKTEISSCSTTLDYYRGLNINDDNKLTGEVKNKTQEYIDSAIGSFEDFIRLVLTTADNLNDLLSMDRSVFIDSITKDAGYDIFDKKLSEFKEYRKEISKNDIKIDVKSLNDEKEKLNEEKINLKEKLNELNNIIINKEQEKPILQKEKEDNIVELNKIDDKFDSFSLDSIKEQISEEEKNITKRKEQLNKINELKDIIKLYDSNKIKNKRLSINELKDIISEYNMKISKYENDISNNTNNINIINKDIENIISNYINSLKSDIKDNNLKISEYKNNFKNNIIDFTTSLKGELNEIISDRNSYNKDIENLMSDGKKLKKLNDDLENSKVCVMCERPLDDVDPEIINKKINSNKSEMIDIKEKIDNLKIKYDNVSKKINSYKEKLDKLHNKDFSFNEELNNLYLDYIDNKNNINEEIEEINRTIELIEEGNLPLDLQDKLKSSYEEKTKLNNKINDLEKEKSDLELSLKYKNEQLESNNIELEDLEKEEEEINKKKEIVNLEEKVKSDIEKIENKITQLNKDISDYNDQIEKINENKKINEKINNINEQLSSINDEISNKMKDKSEIDASLLVIDKDINKINENINIFNKQQKRNEILDNYLKCVHRDGLPSYLLKKSISLINQELNNILIDVDFNLFFDENLILKLSHENSINVSQNAIESSGMERTFSAVALKMALRKINNKSKPNFIMLDEIMGKLVDDSVNKFITLLDTIKKEVDKLVIIEHIHPINYDYLISVEKNEEGISTLNIE